MTIYAFKVYLSGLKGFERRYHIGGGMTLYALHKQMRSDMEFPQDQMILFKAFDAAGNVVARYGLIDLGQGTVDEVRIDSLEEAGIVRFTYFYDVPNRKSVEISCEGVEEPANDEDGSPVIVFSKGPNPAEFESGYVAYEDLPEDQKHVHRPSGSSSLAALFGGDDEDFEDEDEDDADADEKDDDDEDGKEIYDGEESL